MADVPDGENIAQTVFDLSSEFDVRCEERHALGQEKYGAGAFLMADTMEMALEEILDLANYARYTYIRVRLLQESIRAQVAANQQPSAQQGFISNKEVHGGGQS